MLYYLLFPSAPHLDSLYVLDKIYTEKEISATNHDLSLEQEYYFKCLGLTGNVFPGLLEI